MVPKGQMCEGSSKKCCPSLHPRPDCQHLCAFQKHTRYIFVLTLAEMKCTCMYRIYDLCNLHLRTHWPSPRRCNYSSSVEWCKECKWSSTIFWRVGRFHVRDSPPRILNQSSLSFFTRFITLTRMVLVVSLWSPVFFLKMFNTIFKEYCRETHFFWRMALRWRETAEFLE